MCREGGQFRADEAEGQELEPFVPADHQPNPPQLARLPDEACFSHTRPLEVFVFSGLKRPRISVWGVCRKSGLGSVFEILWPAMQNRLMCLWGEGRPNPSKPATAQAVKVSVCRSSFCQICGECFGILRLPTERSRLR